MKEKLIYNLEFPSHIDKFSISNYMFRRVENYEEAFGNLQHLANVSGSEYNIQAKTGKHQITAIVETPKQEEKCILPWQNQNFTKLQDILFLLSLFTGRNVFLKEWKSELPITADHRLSYYGGQLILSLPIEVGWKNRKNNEILADEEMEGKKVFDYDRVNSGFGKSIEKVFNLISTEKWQQIYRGGYFLFLFKHATQRQIIETSFISCWTVWEHLFTLHNRAWLDDKTIEQFSTDKKIVYILNKYFLVNIDDSARKGIERLKKTRNRIIHFGEKTESVDYEEMDMFIRLTEQLIAIIFQLKPSNAFNSFEKLKEVLDAGKSKK